jgi:hypothetical protein
MRWGRVHFAKKPGSNLRKKEDRVLKEDEIVAKLREAAKEGKITCAMAQKMAIENKVPMKRVGELLNQMKIKIAQCQLGCF